MLRLDYTFSFILEWLFIFLNHTSPLVYIVQEGWIKTLKMSRNAGLISWDYEEIQMSEEGVKC